MSESGRIDELVGLFKDLFAAHEYRLQTGTLVNSTLVHVPRQRNTREENATIRSSSIPPTWEGNVNKIRQKDVDARWFRKNGVNHFGFKNHVTVDRETKLITSRDVSPANVHDSLLFEVLLDDDPPRGHEVYADSAYRSRMRIRELRARGFKPRLDYRVKHGHPLSFHQQAPNHGYSRVWC